MISVTQAGNFIIQVIKVVKLVNNNYELDKGCPVVFTMGLMLKNILSESIYQFENFKHIER